MSAVTPGINTLAITWAVDQSTIDENETGMVTISCAGVLKANGITLEVALSRIPQFLPNSPNGPIGLATQYAGAVRTTRGAKALGDGTFEVTATYKIGGALTAEYPDGTNQSSNDRAERRIMVQQEPILTHPCAQQLPTKELNKLGNLLTGLIRPGMPTDPDADPENDFEWEHLDPNTGKAVVTAVTFSDDAVTVDGISLSSLEFAKLIRAGVTTYQRKTVRHSWFTTRNQSASNSDYRAVGTVVNAPPKAPSVGSGFQWLLDGIIDTSSNDKSWATSYEYELSGPGGFLKIYKGGNADIP